MLDGVNLNELRIFIITLLADVLCLLVLLAKVVGCVGHRVDLPRKNMLRNPSIFSMSNLRDVVDRMVSGFFYEAPHSPTCAREDEVVSKLCCTLTLLKPNAGLTWCTP